MENQELKHYGVPGMRWGHHKPIDDLSGMDRRAKKKMAKAQQQAEKIQKKQEKAEFETDYKNYKKVLSDQYDAGMAVKNSKSDYVSDAELDRIYETVKNRLDFVDSKTTQKGKEYMDRLVKTHDKRKTREILVPTVLAAGSLFIAAMFAMR